jgi:poly[(R)-3-hydroxyalkanoate] polymerase subunit PhaE
MDPEHPQKSAPEPLLAAWIKWTMDFWEAMAQIGPGANEPGERGSGSQVEAEAGDFCQAALNLWQAFFSLLSEPGTVAAVFQGIKAPSELVLKMAQAGWRGYFYLHQQWLESVNPEGTQAEPCGFENLDQEIFKVCTEAFDQDLRELLNLPQMPRLSQDGISRAMDRFGQFQNAIAEFIYLLFLPLKKSLRDMCKVLEEGGRPAEDFKEYYRKWLRLLEGHYMTLFKSPECSRTISHTLNALEDFNRAKQEILAEALGALPLPSQRDMEEVYREIYQLKKQVKSLSKQLAASPPAAPGEN